MCRLLIASGVALLLVMPSVRAGAPQVPAIPATRQSLAELIASLSEPGSYFDTDNLISNERSYLHVVPMLRSLAGQAGGNGVYLGVGPDQNFSYIAHLRPTLAILIDIRRDNLLLHLLFKAMFSEAATRASYLALLTGRSETAATRDASIESLVRLVDQARPLGRTDLGRLEARLAAVINGFGVPLSNTDRATIARFHRRFVDAGLFLQFNSTGRLPQYHYPTYRDLLLEVDRDAVRRSFLANEDDFQFVKTLHARDRIVPIVGDLAGRDALANVGRYLTPLDCECPRSIPRTWSSICSATAVPRHSSPTWLACPASLGASSCGACSQAVARGSYTATTARRRRSRSRRCSMATSRGDFGSTGS